MESVSLPVEVSEGVVQPAECSIEDHYLLSSRNATIIRTITYKNLSAGPYPVRLPETKYFRDCEDFEVTVDGEYIKVEAQEYDFFKTLNCYRSFDIKSKGELKIVIKCVWRNFANFADNFFFTISYPDEAKYILKITNLNLENRKYHILRDGLVAKDKIDFLAGPNWIHFFDVKIDANKTHKVEFLILSTPARLNTLAYYVQKDGKPFANLILLTVQHLLSDFVHLAEAFISKGVQKEDLFIVGIPYSTKYKTVEYLRVTSFPHIAVPVDYPFDDVVTECLREAITLARRDGKRILVVEDGGYVVPLFHGAFSSDADLCIGAVEQTANGVWRDEDAIKRNGNKPLFPIIDVAESKIKSLLESPLIGQAVCRNIERLFGREFTNLAGKIIGVVGFGTIGSEVANELIAKHARPKIYCNDPIDLQKAKEKGFEVAKDHVSLIQECDIVIETTGRPWNSDQKKNREIILAFKNGAWFISASSKRMGIDYEELKGLVKPDKTLYIPEIGTRYELTNTKVVTFAANGYPINFFDSESVPDRKIEFIPTMLYKSAEFLSMNYATLPPGIVKFTENEELKKLEEDVADVYSRVNE